MKNNLIEVLEINQSIIKTAFLSYYISMYNSVNKDIGFGDAPITVDEIYDFIQDLKHEVGRQVPDIGKEDIIRCFYLLHACRICKV